jgi:glucose-1-phosphate thymidylyltransferase
MKALVLSGGSGKRLRPITHTGAKQLVPVANKPVLFWGLESLRAAGIAEVGIVVGDTEPEIRQAVGDGTQFGLAVTYLPQHAPLGLAHAVLIARDYLADSDFVMYLGDNLIVGGIAAFVNRFQADRPDADLLLAKVPDPSLFGVAEVDVDGRVTRLVEKPEHPISDLALIGVYAFTPAVHEAVRAIRPSARGELEITDAIQQLIDSGRPVRSALITGYWKDTGNVTDMLEVNMALLEDLRPAVEGTVDSHSELVGRVTVAPGAIVRRSRVVGPAVIGPGTLVSHSYVGPFTSVEGGCRITDSEIEFSIVLRGASIDGVRRIEHSLIGRDVTVTPAPAHLRSHRLVLGDHSEVQIVP